MVKKRGNSFYIYFKPFKDKKIGIKVDAMTKREAEQIEGAVLRACRTGTYSGLDPISREACVRMFMNQDWELPSEFGRQAVAAAPTEELTLWKAAEMFIKYPEIHESKARPRYELCLTHLTEHFGQDYPIKSIWVPEIKQYQAERLRQGASPSTVNWEKSTLSRVFQVLMEMRNVEANPVRLVSNLSQKIEERQAYLALATVKAISGRCPAWYRPILWTAFYAGMRRGEVLGLTRKQLNIGKRMIYLGPADTKEGHWKRVPLHKELIPILQETLRISPLTSEKVFYLRDAKGIREIELETFKNVWPRACDALEFKEPLPRFHDIRHTWRTNARRSGIDPQIAESILGHWFRGKTVNDRYGRIGDKELLDAIDKMTFDHGDTEIFVAKSHSEKSKGNKKETREGSKKKRSCATMT